MSRSSLLVASLLALAAASRATAQSSGDMAGRWSFDIGAQFAAPVGEFATQIDRAWGVGGTARYHLRHLAALGMRIDGAALNYGNERKRVPFSSTINRVLVDMNTSNNIALLTAGPELMAPSGPLRPYAFGLAGVSYFFTESSVGDDNNGGSIARSTNYHDAGIATVAGGGVQFPLAIRTARLAIDVGARYVHNGTRNYLRRGDIVDQPDGSLLLTPRRSPADFWQYQLALSITPRTR
ncbi:MAG TPA: hypothetical protein VJ867_05525 [Gemmatimonadaceae bacterium]|nr:hypothetical protein [Gemmatimonadaceae bacterium]